MSIFQNVGAQEEGKENQNNYILISPLQEKIFTSWPDPRNILVSINIDNVLLTEALQTLETVAPIRLFYSSDNLPKSLKVKVQVKETPVIEVLTEILKNSGMGFVYSSKGHFILYLINEAESQKKSTVKPENGMITGEVTDAETGEALAGATVLIKGTSQGVATDIDGRYTLRRAPVGDQVLIFRHMGYLTQEKRISVKTNVKLRQNVQLIYDHIKGDKLLVVGHQRGQSRALTRQRKSLNIRSVISSERIDRFAEYTVSGALARVAGMHGGTNI
ncbi:MAG: carboxypeptidase-like regulatory domain-containing protein, partial [Balneolales bacterium]